MEIKLFGLHCIYSFFNSFLVLLSSIFFFKGEICLLVKLCILLYLIFSVFFSFFLPKNFDLLLIMKFSSGKKKFFFILWFDSVLIGSIDDSDVILELDAVFIFKFDIFSKLYSCLLEFAKLFFKFFIFLFIVNVL